jgi:hypothetical protein
MPDFTSIRSRRSVRTALSLAAVLAGASAAPAGATVLIQNTAAAYKTGGSTFGGPDVKAYLFTTGSTAFDFGSIEILLTNLTPGTSVAVAAQFEIRAVSGGVPGSVLASSAVINTSVTQQYTWQTFTLTSAFTLAANTSYSLVMTGPSLNSIVKWGNTNPSSTPTGSFGYAVSGAVGSSDGGSTWSSAADSNAFVLNGVPSAVPGGGGAALLGTLLFPTRRRRRR